MIVPASNELIDAFCDQVWLQDGLAPSSLASYRRDLTQWAGWLGRRGSFGARTRSVGSARSAPCSNCSA